MESRCHGTGIEGYMINSEWISAKDELVNSIVSLGFPKELGDEVARNPGSPKAMQRMNAYLHYVKH